MRLSRRTKLRATIAETSAIDTHVTLRKPGNRVRKAIGPGIFGGWTPTVMTQVEGGMDGRESPLLLRVSASKIFRQRPEA